MDDDPLRLQKQSVSLENVSVSFMKISISQSALRIICLALGALGIANMWLAIFADVGVMVIAVLNAIRALICKETVAGRIKNEIQAMQYLWNR